MKAITDEVRIGHGIPDDKGQPLEPEEQPVDRIITTLGKVTYGNAPGQGTPVNMPVRASVTAELTANELAADFATQCEFCANWDPEGYRRDRMAGVITSDELDDQRANVLELANAAELDSFARDRADLILYETLGRCNALTELCKPILPAEALPIYMHVRGGCPQYLPDGTRISSLFKPRPDARRTVTGIRDRILNTASGKE